MSPLKPGVVEVASSQTLWSWIGKKISGKGKEKTEALAPWFQAQFSGREVAEVETFRRNPKGGGRIDAITAATISSRAVATAVLDAVKHVSETVSAGEK